MGYSKQYLLKWMLLENNLALEYVVASIKCVVASIKCVVASKNM